MKVFDASVIVSSFLEKEKFHKEAKLVLDQAISTGETIILPEIVLPEVASAIARGIGNSAHAIDFCKELRKIPNFIFVPIDELLSEIAVEIASKYFLRGADAIYVALAYRYNAELITLDKEQMVKASKIIKVIMPTD
jgi:predicted nucleic acid-binding protein